MTVSKSREPACQLFVPGVENRTDTTDPVAPKLRPGSAFRMNGSFPANANMLLFGNEASGRFGFWTAPGDAVASAGDWNVTKPCAVIAHEPPGKKTLIADPMVSSPQKVASGVTPAIVVGLVTVPITSIEFAVPSAKIGDAAAAEMKR